MPGGDIGDDFLPNAVAAGSVQLSSLAILNQGSGKAFAVASLSSQCLGWGCSPTDSFVRHQALEVIGCLNLASIGFVSSAVHLGTIAKRTMRVRQGARALVKRENPRLPCADLLAAAAVSTATITAAITECTARVPRVVAVFIEVARAAAVPHDTAVSGHLTLKLFVATFSAHEVGMPCIEIADLV